MIIPLLLPKTTLGMFWKLRLFQGSIGSMYNLPLYNPHSHSLNKHKMSLTFSYLIVQRDTISFIIDLVVFLMLQGKKKNSISIFSVQLSSASIINKQPEFLNQILVSYFCILPS